MLLLLLKNKHWQNICFALIEPALIKTYHFWMYIRIFERDLRSQSWLQ